MTSLASHPVSHRDLLRSCSALVGCVLMIGAAVGCGEPEDSEDGPFVDYQDRTDVYEQLDDGELVGQVLLDAVCEATWECYERRPAIADQSQLSFGRFSSVDQCREHGHQMLELRPRILAVGLAIEDGRMDVDPGAAQECRRAYRARICETDFSTTAREPPAECEEFFGGTRRQDHSCVTGMECGSSLTCNHRVETDGCHGRCTSPDELIRCGGELCDDDQFCEAPPGAQDASDHRCVSLLDEGDSCSDHDQCGPQLACIHGHCRPFDVGSEGDDCVAGFHGSHCRPGLICSPGPEARTRSDATCSPVGTDGDRCYAQNVYDTTGCAHDHYCEVDDNERFGRCTPRHPSGQPCRWDHQCRTDHCEWTEDADTGECAEPDYEICTPPDSS